MKEREKQILAHVVRFYLDTGRPVASGVLSQRTDLGLSPASIRNVMASLEKQGLLYSPHTSAGRVPTDAGLRYFVDALMTVDPKINKLTEQEVAKDLESLGDVRRMLQRVTDDLAHLTHFAGLVWVRERQPRRIHRIELVPVSSERVLAVLVSDTGEVQNRLIDRPHRLGDDDLRRLGRKLSELLTRCDLGEALQSLRTEMKLDCLQAQRLLEDLNRWVAEPTEERDLFVRGQGQLLDAPELATIDTVRSLIAAIEEKKQLVRLLEQVAQEETGVKVFIGREHALANMEQVSVVLSRYQGAGNIVGTLGVIGPRRMHYEQVLPIVDCTAKLVNRILGGGIDREEEEKDQRREGRSEIHGR